MCPEEYLPIDEEQWAKTGSKFAKANIDMTGKKVTAEDGWVSELGMPSWKVAGKSYQFPFSIVEGDDKGKEGVIFTGMQKFALEPAFVAAGIPIVFKDGQLVFDKMKFVGKRVLSVWQQFVDSRPTAAGGKGSTYTKPITFLPLPAKVGVPKEAVAKK